MTSAHRDQQPRGIAPPPLERSIERGPGEEAPSEALEQVPLVRRATRQRMTVGWGLPSDFTDDVSLLVGELLANAVLHGGTGRIFVRVGYSAPVLSIVVADRSPKAPRSGHTGPEDKNGRGWDIARELVAERRGQLEALTHPTGKVITCLLPVRCDEGRCA
ncbi:ATP-binding protein [Streptomyces rimosus]|uniref:ATP-binding protein n=1 Tax=Streptomyces rimosus TaxID=1927 RepID=UPI003CD02EF6